MQKTFYCIPRLKFLRLNSFDGSFHNIFNLLISIINTPRSFFLFGHTNNENSCCEEFRLGALQKKLEIRIRPCRVCFSLNFLFFFFFFT